MVGIVPGEVFKVAHPADHRGTVWMNEKGDGVKIFDQERVRIVVGPASPLFLDDLPFQLKLFRVDQKILHPVRLQLQGELNPVGREILKVSGVVVSGEGVLRPAVFGDDPGEFPFSMFGGPLEHHMFQQVRETSFPGDFIPGADLVPDLKGDHRRLMLLHQKDFQAVVKLHLLDFSRQHF